MTRLLAHIGAVVCVAGAVALTVGQGAPDGRTVLALILLALAGWLVIPRVGAS